MLYARAYNNKTKKKAQPVFTAMTEKLRAIGKLGDTWGPMFDDKKADKLASFALPYDQSKRIFNEGALPDLFEVIDRCPANVGVYKVRLWFMAFPVPF